MSNVTIQTRTVTKEIPIGVEVRTDYSCVFQAKIDGAGVTLGCLAQDGTLYRQTTTIQGVRDIAAGLIELADRMEASK